MARKRIELVIASLCFASCVSESGSFSRLTVDQIVARAKELIEQPVTVSGFLRFGDDSRNLWAGRAAYLAASEGDPAPEDPAWDRCISLFNIDGWRPTLLKNDGRQVVISGVLQHHVSSPHEITTSECSEWGLSIKSVVPRK